LRARTDRFAKHGTEVKWRQTSTKLWIPRLLTQCSAGIRLANNWIFNMNNKSLSANKAYFFQITLNDGSAINFDYGVK